MVSVFTMREGEESLTAVVNLSDEVDIQTYADTWILKVAIPNGQFKIVLWPDPSLWSPGSPVEENAVAEEDSFEISGTLLLMDGEAVVSFPPEIQTETLVRFERVKALGAQTALGFSAFVDVEVAGGKLVDRRLKLSADRNGGGVADQVIAGGPFVAPATKR